MNINELWLHKRKGLNYVGEWTLSIIYSFVVFDVYGDYFLNFVIITEYGFILVIVKN